MYIITTALENNKEKEITNVMLQFDSIPHIRESIFYKDVFYRIDEVMHIFYPLNQDTKIGIIKNIKINATNKNY